jgi:hypothetical protein
MCFNSEKGGEKVMDGVPREIFSGKLDRKNASLKEASEQLRITKDKYTPPEIEIKSILGAKSDYYTKFFQGATIVPRNFWFVKIEKLGKLGFNPKSPYVMTDSNIEAKKPWVEVKLSGKVESDYLFATMLSTDLLPFGRLRVRPVVLPVRISEGRFHLYGSYKEPMQIGNIELANYLIAVEKEWKQKAVKATDGSLKIKSPYARLDYPQKNLTRQRPQAHFKVLYTSSATYLAACVVDQTDKFEVDVDGSKLKLKSFIAESKTYWYETDNLGEANYLSAILNSTIVDQIIKPLQTRGLWGARDIHKRPLLLPIPMFKKTDPIHNRIAKLGEIAHKKIQKEILKFINYKSIGKARSEVREILKDEIVEIDNLTVKIMFQNKKPKNITQYIHA